MLALLGSALILFALLLGAALAAFGTPALDARLLLSLAPLREGPRADVWRFVTFLGDIEVRAPIGFAVAAWLLWAKRAPLALILLAATAIETLANSGLKLLFARARPDPLPHLDSVSTLAYPSGHSAHSAALYLLAALMIGATLKAPARGALLAAAIFLVLLIGVSRIVLAVHWPTDAIGGLAFGAGCALIAWSAATARPLAASSRD